MNNTLGMERYLMNWDIENECLMVYLAYIFV